MREDKKKISFKWSAQIIDALERCFKEDRKKPTYAGVWSMSDTIRRIMQLPYVPYKFTDGSIDKPTSIVRFTAAEIAKLTPKRKGELESHWGRRMIVSGLISEGYLKADPVKVKSAQQPIDNKISML